MYLMMMNIHRVYMQYIQNIFLLSSHLHPQHARLCWSSCARVALAKTWSRYQAIHITLNILFVILRIQLCFAMNIQNQIYNQRFFEEIEQSQSRIETTHFTSLLLELKSKTSSNLHNLSTKALGLQRGNAFIYDINNFPIKYREILQVFDIYDIRGFQLI